MSEVKWIKLTVNVFDDEKFDAIKTLPYSNDIQLVWIKLLCLAGVCNENGFLMLTKEIPYTDEMLARRFGMDIGIVHRAMQIFQKLEMIEVVDDVYMVSNWLKYQSTDKLEEHKEKHKIRQQKYRERQKALLLEENEGVRDVTRDVTGDVICSISNSNSYSLSKDINNTSKNIDLNNNTNNDISNNTRSKKKSFIPPTTDEVTEYCIEKSLEYVDPENFVLFYESKNWMVGKNKMSNWKSAVSGWNNRSRNKGEKKHVLKRKQPEPVVHMDRHERFRTCPDDLYEKFKPHIDENGSFSWLDFDPSVLTEKDREWMRNNDM